MRRIYLAAPVRPIEGETKEGNLARARSYYRALSLHYPDYSFLAPWILNCEVFDESPENLELGMRRNFDTIRLCRELWLCGPRVSSGMKDEAIFALVEEVEVYYLRDLKIRDGLADGPINPVRVPGRQWFAGSLL